MKKIALLLLIISYSFSFAQEKYKYVIVPKKFEFFKNENEYNTNFMTKSFFEKQGFEVLYDTDNFPYELANNRCLALAVRAVKNSNLFVTKINFELIDCYNKIVYTSEQGTSREKEFQKAYTESFRIALSSMTGKLNLKATQVNNETFSSTPLENKKQIKSSEIINTSELRAVATESGYNLVNYSGNINMILFSTSLENIFIASKEIYKGVLLKKVNGWFFEYDFDGQVYSEKVEVKF